MKRIIIFSTAYLPFVGGAEVAIKEVTDRLGHEFEFHLITARLSRSVSRKQRLGAVMVHRVGVGVPLIDKLLVPFIGAIVARSLRTQGTDDIYWAMMATYASGAAYIANMLPFGPKVPIVLTLQEGDSLSYLTKKWGGLVMLSWRLALVRSTVVTVISTYLGRLAREQGYSGEIELVPNGVDFERFADAKEHEVARVRTALNKKPGDVFLITTSRLVHKNAVDVVISALSQLPDHIHFVVCGTGVDEAKLRALAHQLQVENRVHFMGEVAHTELPALLAACDIFIRPSRSEGMGNSFIEAMAAGIPVIATQQGGIADFLFDADRNPDKQTTGWAVDVDSPQQIIQAVLRIVGDADNTQRVTDNAMQMVHEQYRWEDSAHKMSAIFHRLASKRSENDTESRNVAQRADALAERAHQGQTRKDGVTAYITHPRAVAAVLSKYGFSETVIAAGLLHDVLEDTPYTPETIRSECGDEVLSIVQAVSEDKTLSWKERKERYVVSVRSGSDSVKAVSAADKIHNISNMIDDYVLEGPALWQAFGAGREGQLAFAHDMLAMFRASWQHPMIDELELLVEKLKKLS